jgi:hypothetical protein
METHMFRMPSRSTRAWLIPLASFTIAAPLAMTVAHAALFSRPPADLDLRRSKLSDHGIYSAEIEPSTSPLAVRRMHSWTVVLHTASGEPVEEARLTVSGGMPQHGHGLPTKPAVSTQGAGRYLIEGVKFSMGGWWILRLHIDGAAGSDNVTYNLSL